jgi:hypothetical protein
MYDIKESQHRVRNVTGAKVIWEEHIFIIYQQDKWATIPVIFEEGANRSVLRKLIICQLLLRTTLARMQAL